MRLNSCRGISSKCRRWFSTSPRSSTSSSSPLRHITGISLLIASPNLALYGYFHLLPEENQTIDFPLPVRSVFGTNGKIDSVIYGISPVKSPVIESKEVHEESKESESIEAPRYFILEEDMTSEKWQHVKDSLVLLEARLSPLLAREKLELIASEPKGKDDTNTAEEDQKKSVSPTEESSNASSPDVASTEIGEETQSIDSIRERIRQLRTSGVKEAFPNDLASGSKEAETLLTQDLEALLVQDIGMASIPQIRKELVKVLLDLKERSRWEVERISSVMELERKRAKDKAEELLEEQALLYRELQSAEKDELLQRGREEERNRQRVLLEQELETRKNEFRTVLERRLEAQKDALVHVFTEKLQAARDVSEKQLEEKEKEFSEELSRVSTSLAAALKSQTESFELMKKAKFIHLVSASYLDLITKCYQHQPFKEELDVFRATVKKSPRLSSKAAKISETLATSGLLSEKELVEAFSVIYNDLKKQVLIPENPSLRQTFVASVVSSLSFDSTPSVSGDSDESLLKQSNQLLRQGDFPEAVALLEQLKPKNKKLAQDYLTIVKQTMETKEALEEIKACVQSFSS